MFGTIFAVYAWNSAPVDGTNIVRSYAAMGREFPFPINFEHEPIIARDHQAQGQQAIEHVNSAFPLWRKQQEVLKLLIEDRREHHRNLKNDGRNMKAFAPGDLVIIKKQVQTTQENGPAKARMHARGPYRVLEQIKPGTYRVQRLPGVQGAGRRGRVTKESAARLTKIPSTLVIHKPTTGIDTRLATYRHAIVDNPLENVLGLHEPGRYRQAAKAQPFAYDKIEDLWQEDVDNMPLANEANNHENDSSDSDDGGDDNAAAPTSQHNDDDTTDNTPTTDDNRRNATPTPRSTPQQELIRASPNTENNEPPSARPETTQIDEPPCAHPETTQNNESPHAQPGTTHTNVRPQNKRKRSTGTTNVTEQRTSTRTSKKPSRYRDQDTTPQNKNTTRAAHTLHKQIGKSRDKLFFIKHIIGTTNTPRWYVVQAQLKDDEDTTTRDEGNYKVRFYIREHANSKTRQLRNCRYWPEIHELRPNGMLGKIAPIRPGKVEKYSKTKGTSTVQTKTPSTCARMPW